MTDIILKYEILLEGLAQAIILNNKLKLDCLRLFCLNNRYDFTDHFSVVININHQRFFFRSISVLLSKLRSFFLQSLVVR